MAGRHRQVRGRGGRHRQPPQRARRAVPVVATIVVLGAGGVSAAAALYGSGGNGHPAAAPTATPRVGASAAAPTAPAPGATAAPPSAPPVSVPPVRPAAGPPPALTITVVGRVSWVEVVGPHGRVLYLGMLRHGHSLAYRRGPVDVTLGDAGAVRLTLHHQVRAHAGRPGQVLHLHVA